MKLTFALDWIHKIQKLCLVTFYSGTNASQIRFNFLWKFTLPLMSQRNFNTLKEFLSKAVIKHALDSAKQLFFMGPFSPSDIVWWGIVGICTWVVSARFVRASFDIWKIARCAHYTDVEKAVDGDCSSFYHSCKPLKTVCGFLSNMIWNLVQKVCHDKSVIFAFKARLTFAV